MEENFGPVVEEVLEDEGYHSNDPRDPGWETLFGLARRWNGDWEGWIIWDTLMKEGLPAREVAWDYLGELVQKRYKEKYWDSISGDDLPTGVDYQVFDMCFTSDRVTMVKILQEVIGAKADGVLGPHTVSKCKVVDREDLLKDLCRERVKYLCDLDNPRFIDGWLNRSLDVFVKSLCVGSD